MVDSLLSMLVASFKTISLTAWAGADDKIIKDAKVSTNTRRFISFCFLFVWLL